MSEFVSFLKKIRDAIIETFTDAEKAVVAGFDALIHSIAENGGHVLMEIAADAVKAAEATGGTGLQKFAAAEAQVIQDLQDKSIPVVANAIKGAIEAAVATLKVNKAAEPAAQ
ncbi:MAG TPA: phage holin, LLH family [Alphaproteobacteria bacterium]|nr:phage holin, LLH family [Alphaproteobacteria bacterium]